MIWYLLSQPSSPNICFMLQRTSSLSIFLYPADFPLPPVLFPRISSIFPSVIEGWVDVFINQLSPTSVHSVCAHVCACWEHIGWVCYGLLWPPSWGNFYPSINLLKTIVFSYFFLPPDQVFQHTPVIGPPKCSNQNKNLQWNAWIWWFLGMAVLPLLAALPSPVCQEFIPFHIF